MVRRLLVLLAVVATAAGLLTSCNRAKVGAEGRLDPDGRVLLTRDAKPITVSRSRSLESGDTIEVADGTAKVSLPGGDVLELAPKAVLVLDGGPDLRSGRMLVSAPAAPRTVRAVGSEVDAKGSIRLDVTLALRVAAYEGLAVVRSGGQTLNVLGLREASVPVIGVLQGPRPLAVDRSDDWDRRLLGDVAIKEPDLESLARGFTGQVSTSNARSAAYYRGLLPGLGAEQGFGQDDVDRLGRPAGGQAGERFRAGDVLLGAAVAIQGKRGTFADRLDAAAAFRAEGASWSVISLDQQVPSIEALLRLVDGAVNVAPLELAAPGSPPSAAVAVVEPPPARATTTTVPTRRTTTTTRRPTTTTTAPSTQPAPQPQTPTTTPGTIVLPVAPLLDAVTDPVIDLLNNLLGNTRR